jgi:uncharacterized repeat protein (TIGR01451 family)
MLKSKFLASNGQTRRYSWLASRLFLALCACSVSIRAAQAEGSRELTASGGDRPFLDYRTDMTDTGSVLRQTVIQVFAQAGEILYLGSSAVGVGSGAIEYTRPDGTTGTCGGEGRINNRAEEEVGPDPLFPNQDGYAPCVVPVGQTGIWQIDFVSPEPSSNVNPTPIAADADWPPQDDDDNFVTAWDVSVGDGNGNEVPGRAFADFLALNMGAFGQSLAAETFILTEEGYLYRIDLNGIDPFGFIFFSNNRGFRGADGESLFSSVPLEPPPDFQNPIEADTGRDLTHSIFFNRPVAGILGTPAPPIPPGEVNNLTFTGEGGTPGQAASPGGGSFSFNATRSGTFRLIIDLNQDGEFGNDDGNLRDRVLTGTADPGENIVTWDGLDGNGNPVPGGTRGYQIRLNLFAAQVHFPFIDVEANPNGIILERLNGEGSPNFIVFYDDSRFSGPGILPNPLDASNNGVSSIGGAHSYGCANPDEETTCFGDKRGIDTWSFLPSADFIFTDVLLIAEADLAVQKNFSTEPATPGNPITFTFEVTNNGPNPVTAADVTDNIPDTINDVSWTCAVTAGTGSCGAASGTGNAIATTVSLEIDATATYTVTGTLSPDAAGTLTNTARVPLESGNSIGDDITDPNPDNNTSTAQTPIIPPEADLSLTKTADPLTLVPGENVTFTITATNDGPLTATNVAVSDSLPPGLSFVSATPSQGTYNNQTGIWTVGNLAPGSNATLEIVATLTATEPVVNRAQVSASDQPDPDSTPGNNVAGEDDQDSVTVPLQVTDLGLTKTASIPVVNVGEAVTYTLTLTNNGPEAATDVAVTEPLPQEFTLQSVTPSQGTYDSSTGIWSVGNLAVGSSATLQLVATANAIGSIPNTAVISALDQEDSNSTNDRASAEVLVQGEPRLRLVKRITNVLRNGMPLEGIAFDRFADDPNDPNDTAPGWSQLPNGAPVGVLGLGDDVLLQTGDVIEYTIYFLSDGGEPANAVRLCDPVPPRTTFIPDSFGQENGILLLQGGTQTNLTNAADADAGTFFPPLNPVSAPCPQTNNPTGAVFSQLGDIPNTAPNNVGFVRFRVEID